MKKIIDTIEYLEIFDSYSDTGAFDEEIKGLIVKSKQLLETVESLKKCLLSIHQVDIPRLGELCEMSNVHKFNSMRTMIENHLNIGE